MNSRAHKQSEFFLRLLIAHFFILLTAGTLHAEYKKVTTTTTTTTYDSSLPPENQPGHNYVTYNLDLKPSYPAHSEVDGRIIINNSYPEALDKTFAIQLYQNGKLKEDLTTDVHHLLPGQTVFSLNKFGIPDLERDLSAVGDWRLVVNDKDLDPSFSKEANFRILVPNSKDK